MENEWEIAVSVAFLVAGFVHGATGFGSGMTSMAIAPLVLPLLDTVAIVSVFVLLVCFVLALQLRASLSNPQVLASLPPLCAGSFIGAPLGVRLLTTTDPRLLKMLLGASMLAFVVERLIHEIQLTREEAEEDPPFIQLTEEGAAATTNGTLHIAANGNSSSSSPVAGVARSSASSPAGSSKSGSPKIGRRSSGNFSSYWGDPVSEVNINRCASFVIGIASGILTGALNEGGPPVIIYVMLKGWLIDDAKATLQFFFLFSSIVTVTQLALSGVLRPSHLYYDLVGLPAAAVGIGLGVLVYNTLDQVLFTRVVVAAMLLTGLAYIGISATDIYVNGFDVEHPLASLPS